MRSARVVSVDLPERESPRINGLKPADLNEAPWRVRPPWLAKAWEIAFRKISLRAGVSDVMNSNFPDNLWPAPGKKSTLPKSGFTLMVIEFCSTTDFEPASIAISSLG